MHNSFGKYLLLFVLIASNSFCVACSAGGPEASETEVPFSQSSDSCECFCHDEQANRARVQLPSFSLQKVQSFGAVPAPIVNAKYPAATISAMKELPRKSTPFCQSPDFPIVLRV